MLTHGYFGLVIPVKELMESPESFEIGGVEMLALDQPNRLLHAATHDGAFEFIGMHPARDVLELVLVGGADWNLTVERAVLGESTVLCRRGREGVGDVRRRLPPDR
jgi:hypothetical protein